MADNREDGVTHGSAEAFGSAFELKAAFSLFPKVDSKIVAEGLSPSHNPSDYKLVFEKFEHSWQCGAFNRCTSTYYAEGYVQDVRTGQRAVFDVLDSTAVIQDSDPGFDPSSYSKYFHHSQGDVSSFSSSIGTKDGRDPDYWGIIKCWLPDGWWVAFNWHSHA